MDRKSRKPNVLRIVSGGQTGVDRGALEAAIQLGIEHGGWCPKGRLAEDGAISRRYRLRQTASPVYRVRTEQNVIDSDGTLILYCGRLYGGTDLTRRLAAKHGRPCCLVNLLQPPEPERVREWLRRRRIETLNVAGPRESSAPGIGRQAMDFLTSLFAG
jgi:hypothetical protein